MRSDGGLSEVGSGSVFVTMPGTGDYSWRVKFPDCGFETRPVSTGWLTACTHHINKDKFRRCNHLEVCQSMTPKPQLKPVAFGDMAINTKSAANAKKEYRKKEYEPARQMNRYKALEAISRGVKACTSCGEVKEFGEFYVDKTYLTGRRGACKACVKLKREQREAT